MTLFGGRAPLTMIQGAKSETGSLDGELFGAISADHVPASSSAPAISLESVLSADMPVAWDESVSIIEALCHAVQGNVLRTIPGADEIFLTGSGTVTVGSGSGTPEPVDAGRHLLDLLGKGTVPAPLRLFASQAVRAEQHVSIVEFQQGLAYFAKPGGQARIIAVFERCSKELVAMPFPSERSAAKPPKATDKAEAKSERSALWRRGRKAAIAAGGVVVTVLVVWAGYFGWQELSKAFPGPGPVAEETEATAAPAPQRLAARKGASASAPSVPQSAPVASAAGNTPTAIAVAPVDLALPGQPESPAAAATVESGSTSAPAAGTPAAPAAPLFVQDVSAEPIAVDRVYTSADPGVVPATLVREQLLPPATGASPGVAPLQLEILVSAEGTVERARFLVAPQRMTDMMLLSNAKTWQFNPALKDGRAVRSRVVLAWLVAP